MTRSWWGVFSRFLVARTLAASQNSLLAKELLEHAMGVHGNPDVIHAETEGIMPVSRW